MTKDNVNHPEHYQQGQFETIDEMVLLFGEYDTKIFCKLNAYKYKARAPFKGHMEEDLKKADWYLKKYQEIDQGGL